MNGVGGSVVAIAVPLPGLPLQVAMTIRHRSGQKTLHILYLYDLWMFFVPIMFQQCLRQLMSTIYYSFQTIYMIGPCHIVIRFSKCISWLAVAMY